VYKEGWTQNYNPRRTSCTPFSSEWKTSFWVEIKNSKISITVWN